jgi:hypothetical protein
MAILDRLLSAIGRRLHPLFNPHAPWLRDRVETMVAEQRREMRAVRGLLERQEREIQRLHRDAEALKDKSNSDATAVRKTLGGLHTRVRRQLGFSERVLKRATEATQSYREERVLVRLEKLARGNAPILVGPWTGEVGFELVYWIPFVRWAIAHYAIDPARLVVCSRGGPASWYQGLAGRYVDVFDVASQDEFRKHTVVTPKQRTLRAFDREILRRAVAKRGLGAVSLLHPAMMYHLFMPYWKQQAPDAQVIKYSQYVPLRPFEAPELQGRLPVRYVAVRFYFSQCFPDTPENRAFVGRTLSRLAEETDVVVLNPGMRIDDHDDVLVPRSPRIHVLDEVMRPERNLEIQASVISRASGFVGTYGGYSYLAPFFGTPSVSFYSERNFYFHHLHMAQHAIDAAGGATLTVVSTSDAALLRSAVGSSAARTAIAGTAIPS